MQLYGFGGPSRATRVAWALEEAGASWSYVATSPRAPEVVHKHPLGKLPLLVDGELVLSESFACCTHVADRYPQAGLVPPVGTEARAAYLQWGSFVISELEQPLWTLAKHTRHLPEALRVDVGPVARHEFRRAVSFLGTMLGERAYLVGDRFTCADILVTHTLRWAVGMRFGDEIPDNVKAYGKHHAQRPALQRANEREAAGTADGLG